MHQPWVALVVLGLSIALEFGSLLGCLREIRKLPKDKSFGYWLRNTRNAELVVVLGEDVAALVGLALAFAFVALAAATGNSMFDAIGSITIGVVLVCVSIFIAIRIKGLIVGRSAEEDLQEALEMQIAAEPGITKLFRAITLQMGPQVMLAVKVRMKAGISIEEAVECLNRLERNIKARFPEVTWCFVEPDNAD
jgi:divalent metal cation (Fe/Co/Zn/Cd) transporter